MSRLKLAVIPMAYHLKNIVRNYQQPEQKKWLNILSAKASTKTELPIKVMVKANLSHPTERLKDERKIKG